MLSFKKLLLHLILLLSLCFTLSACAGLENVRVQSELAEGQRSFQAGYYKHALQELLPLACDGNAEAEYAVGYMYYYGAGVAQDTEVGYFWIARAAQKNYPPAIDALRLIKRNPP